jgi:hypothetical protein
MEKCSFESGRCDIECKKYSMCAVMSLQKQLLNIQEQVSFLYNITKNVIEDNKELKGSIGNLCDRVDIFTADLIELYYNDSETSKESATNEKKN